MKDLSVLENKGRDAEIKALRHLDNKKNGLAEIDVSTPLEPDLHQFTEQQIEDFCVEMEGLSIAQQVRPRIEWTEDAVQIIRQLQKEVKERDKLDKQNFIALRECSLSAKE